MTPDQSEMLTHFRCNLLMAMHEDLLIECVVSFAKEITRTGFLSTTQDDIHKALDNALLEWDIGHTKS